VAAAWVAFVAAAWVAFVASAWVASAWGASGTFTAPAEVGVGSLVEIGWSGPAASGDFISIDASGAPETSYGVYGYPAAKNPIEIRAPDVPGDYVIRFHRAVGYGVDASQPLRIVDATATFEAPAQVAAGERFDVRWTGPDNQGDFVAIDRAGAPDRDYGPYAYSRDGSTLSLRAPDAPGDYEIRYHLASTYRVIGRAPLAIGGVDATIEAPASIGAGSRITVKWTGPADQGDFISVDAAGAGERDYGRYAYTVENPVVLRAPDVPGDYVLRYHTGQSYRVLATHALRVEPATATLEAPADVVAGHVFEVRWQGPDGDGDFITLVPVDAPESSYGANNAYPRRGNPVRIEAARDAGDYEVRYLTGEKQLLLARAPVRVTPDTRVGRLAVAAASGTAQTGYGAIELVLDASGSMLQRIGGDRRIDLAKRALSDLARAIEPGTGFALRVFGHREANACRTDLELPLAPIDVAAATARIGAIDAMNLAKTPIGQSLAKVKDDVAGASGPVLVVLVTDGEETCEGDPRAAIEALRAAGLDVRVNIVGFAIDEVGLKETFQAWARAGNGGYFDAQSGDELTAAVLASLETVFEVLDGERVVASGVVGGGPIDLPAGTYRVRVPGTSRTVDGVVVEPGALRNLSL
jgi:hypothetical protein